MSQLAALTRITSLVAAGLPEERLAFEVASCSAAAVGADLAAVYLLPELPSGAEGTWQLVAATGAAPEVVRSLAGACGQGTGVLAPLFQNARDVLEPDLLDGGLSDSPGAPQLPLRGAAGVAVRRRHGGPIGALIVGARRPRVLDQDSLACLRAMAQLLGVGIDNARLAAGQQRDRRMADQSAETLAAVLESVGSGVCVVDLDGSVRLTNKALRDLFGLDGRTTGLSEVDVFGAVTVPPRDQDEFLRRLRELAADPTETDASEWELATDPPRIVQRRSAPMRNSRGEVVGRLDVYTDITETRRLYTQLLGSEKLRAIGEMASGVAHDFNNLLASIVGQTDLLHPDDLPPSTGQAIATIRQAALDGARMVRNLQGLARPRIDLPSTAADLNETVQQAVDMARPRWASAALHGHGAIELRVALDDGASLPRVGIDPSELREVLLNVLFNAADAMPEGGRIEVVTRPGRTPGFSDVEVRDTGHGMPEAVRARIFEPFYSTKGAKGSGLGLAVAYSILSRAGGEMGVESRVGEGATFTIRLPNVSAPAPPAEPAAPLPVAAPQARVPETVAPRHALQGARILVADDEPGLVTVVSQLMERSGATVTIANGGQAALAALRESPQPFDVVITDLDMPEVDGWAVSAEAKRQRSDTRVVMMTGWAGEIPPQDVKARGVDLVLGKPCSRADLEAAITQLLGSRQARPAALDVLLVDDEPAFGRSIRDLLGLQGHRVTLVESAQAALDTLNGQTFDVVLTDYSLGQTSGAQLAAQLAERRPPPFVVLITGYAIEIDDPTLLSRGVAAVLPKPCRGDDLRAVLARVPR